MPGGAGWHGPGGWHCETFGTGDRCFAGALTGARHYAGPVLLWPIMHDRELTGFRVRHRGIRPLRPSAIVYAMSVRGDRPWSVIIHRIIVVLKALTTVQYSVSASNRGPVQRRFRTTLPWRSLSPSLQLAMPPGPTQPSGMRALVHHSAVNGFCAETGPPPDVAAFPPGFPCVRVAPTGSTATVRLLLIVRGLAPLPMAGAET